MEGAPPGATINPTTGAFSWQTSPGTASGEYKFKVIVSDGHGGSDEQEVTVTVLAQRFAPVLAPIGTKTVNEETKLTIVLSATDQGYNLVGGDPKLEDLADNGGLTQTHALQPDSPARDAGYTTLTTDQRGEKRPKGDFDDIGAFEADVIVPNEDPILDPISNKSVHANEKLTFTATASDPDDGDNAGLTYAREGAPVGATINPTTGAFSWQTSPGTATGEYKFKVVVSDGHGGSDEQEVTVTVLPRRFAPVLAPIGTKTVNEETKLTIVLSATDQDTAQNLLTFSCLLYTSPSPRDS